MTQRIGFWIVLIGWVAGSVSAAKPPQGARRAVKAPARTAAKKASAPSPAPAPVLSADKSAPTVSTAAPQALDVTIKGEAKDEIPIEMDAVAANFHFKELVPLSREGQLDRVLSGPMEHLSGQDIAALAQFDSRQALSPSALRLPSPPFFRVELTPGLDAASWELQVRDQSDNIIFRRTGTRLPKYVVEWDGYEDGVMLVRPGPAYTPKLILRSLDGSVESIFGDALQFDAMQYDQSGTIHMEFDNTRLFQKDSAEINPDARPLIQAALDVLRRNAGRSVDITVAATPAGRSLAERRLAVVRTLFTDALRTAPILLRATVLPAGPRGDVTDLSCRLEP
jgi:flagellar motor protein MotB